MNSSIMKNVYIPIEVSSREEDCAMLIGSMFCGLGCRVYILNNWYFSCLLKEKAIEPGLVIDKDLSHRAYSQRIKPAKAMGFIYAAKVAEDLDFRDSWHWRLYSEKKSVKACDYILYGFQSEKLKLQKALESMEVPDMESRFVKFREPRVELLSSSASAIYRPEIEAARRLFGDFILVSLSETPSYDNATKMNLAAAHEDEYRRFFIGSEKTNDQILEFINRSIRAAELLRMQNHEMIDAIISCLTKIDRTVMIRPHPALKRCGLQGLSEIYSYPNVEVCLKGGFEQWFHGSSIHITSSCTTALCSRLSNNNKSLVVGKRSEDILKMTYSAEYIANTENIEDQLQRHMLNSSLKFPPLPIEMSIVSWHETLESSQRMLDDVPESSSENIEHLASNLPRSHKFKAFDVRNTAKHRRFCRECQNIIVKQSNRINAHGIDFRRGVSARIINKDLMELIPSAAVVN